MCGIVAWLCFATARRRDVNSLALQRAVLHLRHRGPDAQRLGVWAPESGLEVFPAAAARTVAAHSYQVGLGHSRLSIVDLSPQSDQPMLSADGRHALVFNGAIYNYLELRDELEGRGCVFRTRSDTEVLLQALIQWGPQALHKLNGMWAFAFFDLEGRSLLLSRDRFGKKPLFQFRDEHSLILASEYKALFAILGEEARELDPGFVDGFLRHERWCVEGTRSAYRGVESVPAGAVLSVDLEHGRVDTVFEESPRDLFEAAGREPLGDDWGEQLAEDLASAVRLRLRSDVPVGVLLSGGVDSSLVAGFAEKLQPAGSGLSWYTGDAGGGNDLHFARRSAETLGVSLTTVDVRADGNALDLLSEMTAQYEIPVWVLGNSIAMFQMYRAMHADGIRVVLDGTGGDEIFGGYFRSYALSAVSDHVAQRSWSDLAGFIYHCWRHGQFPASRLLRHAIRRLQPGAGAETLEATQLDDLQAGNLPSWLYMNDQNSMHHSIEARSPLLDARLLTFLRLPATEKFGHGFNKLALRRAMPANLSDDVRWRRDKQGFRWQRDPLVAFKRREMLGLIRASPTLEDRWPEALARLEKLTPKQLMSYHALALLEDINRSRAGNLPGSLAAAR